MHSVVARSSARRDASHRHDIQGLRAVAVVAVVINHLDAAWLPGGFAGVDVFFVISGFLITGRLLRTVTENRPLAYLGAFYLLRIRRILPAALLALTATVIAAHLVFVASRAHRVDTDALWSALFLANWRFATVGTDYFQQGLAASPLQHYWSLAVEEQFYLAWPLLVLLAAVAMRKRLTLAISVTAAAVIVASLSWGWSYSASHPAQAYFSTLTRGWELAAGALLAMIVPLLRRRSANVATALSWSGLVIVGAALVWTPESHGFPVPWATLAVVGACLVVAAGALGDTRRSVVLTNPVSVWIGDISYSIYLWHFPAIIILEAVMGGRTWWLTGAALTTTLALATASYYFVEEPVRSWSWHMHARLPLKAFAAGAAALIAAQFVLFHAITEPEPTPVQVVSATPMAQAEPPDPTTVTVSAHWRQTLEDALTLTDWPDLVNEDDLSLYADGVPMWIPFVRDGNFSDDTVLAPAVGSDPGKVAVLLGDSMMMAYIPMIRAVLEPEGWTLVNLMMWHCSSATAPHYKMSEGDAWATDTMCEQQHALYSQIVQTYHPTLVLSSEAEATRLGLADEEGSRYEGTSADDAYTKGLEQTIDTLTSDGARFVLLSAPPESEVYEACRTPGSVPLDCVSRPAPLWLHTSELGKRAAEARGAVYLNMEQLFCVADQCPLVVGDVLTKVDGGHITETFATMLAPEFRAALASRGLLAADD